MGKWLTLLLFLVTAYAQIGFTPDPSSFVEYHAADERGAFTGRAPLAEVSLDLDPENLRVADLKVRVHPAEFDSGNFLRDTNARRTVFDTAAYPEIRLEVTRLSTEGNALSEGLNELSLVGDLTMHGVTQEVRFPLIVRLEGETLSASGEFSVLLSDFGMSRPSFLGWVVEDTVQVRIEVSGVLTP